MINNRTTAGSWRARTALMLGAGLMLAGLSVPAAASTAGSGPVETETAATECGTATIDRAFDLAKDEVADPAAFDVVNFTCLYDEVRLDFTKRTKDRRRPGGETGGETFEVAPNGPAVRPSKDSETDAEEEADAARASERGSVTEVAAGTAGGKAKPQDGPSIMDAYPISDYIGATDDRLVYGQKNTSGQVIWASTLNLRTRLYLSGYTAHGFKIGWNELEGRYVEFTYTAETRRVVNNWADDTLQTFQGGQFGFTTSYSQPEDKKKGIYIGTNPAGSSYYVEMTVLRIWDRNTGEVFYPPEDISTLRFYCGTTFCTF